MLQLTKEQFHELRQYIHRISGIELKDEKQYLVQQRLEPVVRSLGLDSFQLFIDRLKKGVDYRNRDHVIEAITTNETSFFRDGHPFVTLKDFVLPKMGEMIRQRKLNGHGRKGTKVNIWCAASSTGQEPYTIAMQVYEYATANSYRGISPQDFGILATDISSDVLARSIAGEYTDFEISRGLSQERRDKFFAKRGNIWAAKDIIQNMIDFRKLNLSEPFTMIGGMDLIFCRNVLIYFDDAMKMRIFKQFHQLLSEEGFLMLGACENLNMYTKDFESTQFNETILYKPKKKAASLGVK